MKFAFSAPVAVQLAPAQVSSVLANIVTVDLDAKTVAVAVDDGSGKIRHMSFPLPAPPYDLAAYVGQQLGLSLGVTVTESVIAVGP